MEAKAGMVEQRGQEQVRIQRQTGLNSGPNLSTSYLCDRRERRSFFIPSLGGKDPRTYVTGQMLYVNNQTT